MKFMGLRKSDDGRRSSGQGGHRPVGRRWRKASQAQIKKNKEIISTDTDSTCYAAWILCLAGLARYIGRGKGLEKDYEVAVKGDKVGVGTVADGEQGGLNPGSYAWWTYVSLVFENWWLAIEASHHCSPHRFPDTAMFQSHPAFLKLK
jgi:hypothetical protein